MNAGPTWTNEWLLFVGELERALQRGATNDNLESIFGGHKILWLGTIEKIDFDALSAVVNVALPVRPITLASGETIVLDGLTLDVCESNEAAWLGLAPGDEVEFGGELGEPKSPFPCIEVKTLRSGKSIIMIRIGNAVPHLNPSA